MEIPECPVVRPTLKEFQNFSDFIEKLDQTYKKDYGIVKVFTFFRGLLFFSISYDHLRLSHLLNGKLEIQTMLQAYQVFILMALSNKIYTVREVYINAFILLKNQ